ncbi:hypothetical protein [Nocardioides sp.]|uniref:hypothetical protein n=1 Tax=Nocardioides sp. TaxID=35761 RepID=UPI0039E5CF80
MRTTLEIDDDVLQVARERARHEKRSVGAVVSDLARAALIGRDADFAEPEEFMGFRPIPSRGGIVTNEMIDKIREEIGA